jgi:tetratricopeptide (TPR) repeat protein
VVLRSLALLLALNGAFGAVAWSSGFIQAMQLHEKAVKAQKAGDLPQAIQAAEAELEVVEKQMAGAPIHKGRVLPFLGGLYLEAGRFSEAEGVFAQALALRIQEVGATSGDVATLRSRLGECRAGQGDHEQAIVFFEQAIAVLESKGERFDLTRAAIMELLAVALEVLERDQAAQIQKKAALVIYTKKWGAKDPRIATAKVRLGLSVGP